MTDKKAASEIKRLSLSAIRDLTEILNVSRESCSDEEFECLRKGVGIAVGNIQTSVLDVIYAEHPELDDL